MSLNGHDMESIAELAINKFSNVSRLQSFRVAKMCKCKLTLFVQKYRNIYSSPYTVGFCVSISCNFMGSSSPEPKPSTKLKKQAGFSVVIGFLLACTKDKKSYCCRSDVSICANVRMDFRCKLFCFVMVKALSGGYPVCRQVFSNGFSSKLDQLEPNFIVALQEENNCFPAYLCYRCMFTTRYDLVGWRLVSKKMIMK